MVPSGWEVERKTNAWAMQITLVTVIRSADNMTQRRISFREPWVVWGFFLLFIRGFGVFFICFWVGWFDCLFFVGYWLGFSVCFGCLFVCVSSSNQIHFLLGGIYISVLKTGSSSKVEH